MNTSELVNALHAKRIEPAPRNKDGVRYIAHRFPIKNGISAADLFYENLQKSCALRKVLVRLGEKPE